MQQNPRCNRLTVNLTDAEIEAIDDVRGRRSRSSAAADLILAQLKFEHRKASGEFSRPQQTTGRSVPQTARQQPSGDYVREPFNG